MTHPDRSGGRKAQIKRYFWRLAVGIADLTTTGMPPRARIAWAHAPSALLHDIADPVEYVREILEGLAVYRPAPGQGPTQMVATPVVRSVSVVTASHGPVLVVRFREEHVKTLRAFQEIILLSVTTRAHARAGTPRAGTPRAGTPRGARGQA